MLTQYDETDETSGLRIQLKLENPSRILKRRADVPIASMTTYDLILHLESNGWRRELWATRDAPTPFDTAASNPKTWFVKPTSVAVCHWYLRALASPSELSTAGHNAVEHFQTTKYYKGLLGIVPKRRSTRATDLKFVKDDTVDSVNPPLVQE